MKFTRILSLCLVALLMLSMIVACDGNKTPETTTDQGTEAPEITTEEKTDAPTEPETTEPETTEPETTEPETTEPETTEPETTKPETTEPETTEPAETEPETSTEEETTEPEQPAITYITIAEALELCGEEGNITEERYYIRATVVSITNAAFGAMVIADETGEISVYGTYSADGEINYSAMEDKPYRGDQVVLHCILQNYNGTKEVKNARLIEFTHVEPDVDFSVYTDMSIADAREAATGTKIKVDGVVAKITFANGFKPNGLFLVDETGSIYVFDGDLAQRVSEGDKITVAGDKDYWILETEQSNAQKFGYKGSCQLANAYLLDQDNSQDYAFDKSWITESCIKDILETPVSENVTTTIYKVNALVKRVDGTGFTNYYFFDLDGETGNYTYTQCNGADFEWLDAFDGKICTVYISPINCKSTAGDCFFRLVPIEVKDEGFTFDPANAPAHALKYYAMGQFGSEYASDPALEMITSVSSLLLNFGEVTLSYTSSNEEVVYFTTADGKTVMHCAAPGTVTVTVTATLGDVSVTDTAEITVLEPPTFDFVDVQTAINAANGDVVVVKGIVGPSLVNRDGFYLIDETGVIAIFTTKEVVASVSIGDEIIISATRDVKTKGGDTYFGQSMLTEVTVLANYYGAHEYSTETFVTDQTLADMLALSILEDHTTTVFVVKGKVNFPGGYSAPSIVDGDTTLQLYCSGGAQYSWLNQFADQEITLEIALCNWNDKKAWKGCILAVHTEDGKVLNTLNFDVK